MSRPQSFRTPSGEELTAALIEKVDQRRQLDADILDILGHMDREHIASDAGYPSLAACVSHATRMSKRTAARLVAQAAAIRQTVTPTGHVTPPPLPKVRELVREGAVDGEHIDAITATINQLPESTPAEVRDLVESTLADTARVCDPLVVRQQGKTLLDRIDQDGTAPDDTQPAVRNELHIRRTRDGGCQLRGRLTKEPTETLLALLGPHAKPQPPAPGIPDPRSEAQRDGDGLAAILNLGIASGDNPDHGGEKPHVNLLVDLNRFLDGSGVATADSGSLFCPHAVLQAACDADV